MTRPGGCLGRGCDRGRRVVGKDQGCLARATGIVNFPTQCAFDSLEEVVESQFICVEIEVLQPARQCLVCKYVASGPSFCT
jgi:hypothetical protein